MSETKTVIIADDSASIRAISSKILEGSEFSVIAQAANGQEAVDQYKEHNPDIVILDIVMPELDGKGALEEILKFDPDARVLMSSSLGTEENVQECLKVGAKSFITKPYQAENFLNVLRNISE